MYRASLNHCYRLVFNESLGAWVAVPETARSKGKGSTRSGPVAAAVAATLWLAGLGATPSHAGGPSPLPTGGKVVAGSGTIGAQVGNKLTVNQTSQRMAAEWQTFSIDKNHQVEFVQPAASAVALNRVTGPDASVIQGQITANGQVFLVNPNGVLFTNTAQVNVGGLVASTLNISNADFMAGRYRFDGESTADVTNQGKLIADRGGYVAMIAGRIVNEGTISAPGGAALLGAGQTVTLDLGGPVQLQVERGALNAQIANGGVIQAGGGRILLSAKAASELGSAVINQAGHVEASSLVANERGEIVLRADGGAVINSGNVQANGVSGGSISVRANALIDAGQWEAKGSAQAGGVIDVAVTRHLEQTVAATMDASGVAAGGSVRATSGGSAWFSGSLLANATAGRGGEVAVTASDLTVAGAQLRADGATGGGRVRVGGGWQGGDADVGNADRVTVTAATHLSANATSEGNGGTVVVWSEQGTGAAAKIAARGAGAGRGGAVEVSSRGQLAYAAQVDVTAASGRAGTVLLDPKNIVIDGSTPPSYTITPLLDPAPVAGDQHGVGVAVELSGGNIVVASYADDAVATNAGAVRLYRPDGTLVSSLTGTTANDLVGSSGITALTNGNYVVRSSNWSNGAATGAGAVTWGSGTTGVSGAVSAANSLVGSTTNDQVGNIGVTALSNGNYVVNSYQWNNGAANQAGAVTWGSGTTGVSGVVSAANSLVGSTANDRVGYAGITALTNGSYVVNSYNWNNGFGAVTWGSGTAGVSGVVGAANSLVGGTVESVGWGGVIALSNGNYLVNNWSSLGGRGAVTWGSGTTGVSGVVSAANSLVGSTAGDYVGGSGLTILSDGSYLVRTASWDNGAAADAGAVTWGSGTAGVSGVISAANSLVGSKAGDQVGSGGIAILSNGNYVVNSPNWDNGAITDAGASTWGSGTTGVKGVINGANSLVGTTAGDQVGYRIMTLSNGNYVVSSENWGNYAGAVTWGSGTTGVIGAVGAANSLVGGTSGDMVGYGGVTALSNGNYVVRSDQWSNGVAFYVGAVTWGSGTTGVRGVVSAANSLVGSTALDQVGSSGITALSNGSYVVRSASWDNGAVANAGAVTWGSGTSGVSGVVSAANSLVGSTADDLVGNNGITVLSNGNYVVNSYYWDNGAALDAGAVTWGSGTAGVSGVVSAANSLVGGTTNDHVGSNGIRALGNGHYLVFSSNWHNGAATDAGAVTWGSGTAGVSGVLSAANSLVGSSTNDQVGNNGVTLLTNGNYVVNSYNWDNGALANAGAVTWGSGTAGVSGVISAANSLVGSRANDQVGNNGVTALANGNYVVNSSSWDNGALFNAGAVTWGSGTAGVSGVVSAANSLVGSKANDQVGSGGVTGLANGNYVVRSSSWDNGAVIDAGAVTWGSGTTGVSGAISAANSLVGSSASDQVGSGGVTALANGNYVVRTTAWRNGAATNAGAVTLGSGTTGVSGAVSAANSLVGSTSNDQVGSSGVQALSDGRVLVRSPLWSSSTGRLDILGLGASANWTYAATPGANSTIGVSQLKALLDTGANVTLQANNDITLSNALSVDNAGGNGGSLTLQAGRSLLLNADITTDNGNLTLIANDRAASGVVDAHRDPGAANVTMADGTTIAAGTGTVAIELRDGAGNTNNTAGTVTLATVQAGSLAVDSVNLGRGITAADKTYDGNATATVTGDTVTGLAFTAGSNLSVVPATATFSDKNAGTGKTVTAAALQVTGFNGAATANATNAAAAVVATTTANIGQRALAVTATGQNKVYDGTNAATVVFGDDRIGGDTLTVAGTSSFGDKNVGTGKAIGVSGIGLTGADAGNYSLAATTATTTADITQRALTVTASGQNKVYDGTRAATVAYGDNRIGGDVLTVSGTASFGDKNAANGKAVGVSGITVGGADAGNYTFNTTAATTADITRRSLTVTATGQDKVYDGTLAATVSYGDNRVGGDALTVTGAASFGDKNVGTGKAVGVTGVALGGADAGNYALAANTASTTANITQRSLTVTATGQNKVYDGTLAATVSYGDNRVGGDALTVTGASSFGDKNVGTGKAVGVTGIGLTGADAGNYALAATTAATTANITQRSLTVSATGQDKVYDGTLAATVAFGDNRVGGDVLAVAGTSTFGDKNVGTGKAVGVTGIVLSGADAGNYALASTTAATTANITQRSLTVTATGQNKVYDGTMAATVSLGDNRVGGDALTVTGAASFGDKNAGTGKAVGVTGIGISGADAGNYSLAATTAGTTADITQRALTVTATGQDKVYDGTAAATATLGDNRLGGDALTLTGAAAFADKNAGTGKAVTISGLALAGADAGNYSLASTTTATTADITRRTLAVTATGQNKVYDGTTTATVNYGDDRVAGDALTVTGTSAFGDRNVGANKAVGVSGIGLAGADAGNYSLTATTAATTADITARPLDFAGSRTFDGSPVIAGSVLTPGNVVAGDLVTLSGQAAVASPDAGNYTSFTSNSLVSSDANYSTTGGNVSVTITAAPPPPTPAPAPAAAPAVGSVSNAIAATLEQSERDEASQEPTQRLPQQQQQLVQEAPALHLQVVQGGIRMPAEATIGELRQEK